ncbi:MAG TPA: hypothetical protein PKN17_02990 [Bacillota bacterium]|nr:hypothetical protein [Bacillota bacterium]
MKKYLLLLFLVLLIICSGCKVDNPVKDPGNPSDTIDTADIPAKDVLIFSRGEMHVRLTRPDKCTETETAQYKAIRNRLESLSGGSLTIDTDAQYKGHTYDATLPEILLGHVSYPECHELLSELAYNECGFGVVGNKVVITAWADEALPSAVFAFLDYAEKNMADGTLTIPAGYRQIETSRVSMLKPLAGVPAFPGGVVEAISDCADGFTQVTISETDATMLDDYCTLLGNSGYSFYSENRMADVRFITYTKDEKAVYAYYVPHSKTTRIIAFSDALLPPKDRPSYSKVRECSITLFGLEVGGNAGGLGFMMQLEDGSFVIVDGGHNTVAEASQIHKKMTELAPDPSNIVIRAWVITHAHGDHYGAFVRFASTYSTLKTIKIESFIFNFCDTKEQTQYMSDGASSCSKVRSTINTYYPNADVYKCLTGQVFHFPGADMEILTCMSDFIPKVIGLEGMPDTDLTHADGNIQSIVVRFITTAEESQSVMVTGDVSKVNVDEMCARFGDYLKSYIMTVPHHGWNQNRYRARNGTIWFYSLVDPSIVLWPDGVEAQAKKLQWNGVPGSDWEANYYLLNSLNVVQCIVAGSTTVTLTLPYYYK